MKIIIFQGGLGNQIFEYVFHQYIKKTVDDDVRVYFRDANSHNGFELAKWFDVSIRQASFFWRMYIKIADFLMYKGIRKHPYCNQKTYPEEKTIYDGYWQRKAFYSPDAIRFKDSLIVNEKNREIIKQMVSTESVSIHVRRGDYLLPQFAKTYGGICTEEYYRKAIETLNSRLSPLVSHLSSLTSHLSSQISPSLGEGRGRFSFFVFSDDIEWVKENLNLENAVYVNWNTGKDSVFDMYLMSHCKHNIIANSSFSYWAARLNNDAKSIIYPKKWYNGDWTAPDIFPDNWTGI